MLIKVKKNLHGLFLHQNTPFKPIGEKHNGKKLFWTTLLNKLFSLDSRSLGSLVVHVLLRFYDKSGYFYEKTKISKKK